MPKKVGGPAIDALYAAPQSSPVFLDVPERGFVVVDGHGAPGGPAFAAAVQAAYAVGYGVRFALKKSTGAAAPVLPLEALWWLEGSDGPEAMERLAFGGGGPGDAHRGDWHWRVLLPQLPPVGEGEVERARSAALAKAATPALDRLRFERWAEGPSAQLMHIGPYDAEERDIAVLHHAIAEHGLTPRGRHHEVYLSDPRRCAPARLRTILRHPVATQPR